MAFAFLGIVLVVSASLPGVLVNIVFAAVILRMMPPSMSRIWVASAPHFILASLFSFRQFAHGAFAVVLIPTPFFGLTTVSMVTAVVGGSALVR